MFAPPFGQVLARLRRIWTATRRRAPETPAFLPDFVSPMPDQMNELRYGKGRLP